MSAFNVNFEPTVLVHGGAGFIYESFLPALLTGVKIAASSGYNALLQTDSVLNAVQEAVSSMEKDPNFNAGYGSALTLDGKVEMDAALMNGACLNAGCVSCVEDIKNPIVLVRHVMTHSPHKFLSCYGAMKFAAESNIPLCAEGSLVTYNALNALQNFKRRFQSAHSINDFTFNPLYAEYGLPSAVGAVAIDSKGNVAAGTSSGGFTGKLSGCVGNAAILGGGIYADNAMGAVVATGDSEVPMRYNVAMRILTQMEDNSKLTAQQATETVLNNLKQRFNTTAGAISIDKLGVLGIYHTTPHMPWAYQREKTLHFAFQPGEYDVKTLE